MGTYYRELAEPFSSLRVEDSPSHSRVSLWEGGAFAGTLTVRSETLPTLLQLLSGKEVAKRVAIEDPSRGPENLTGGKTKMNVIRAPRTDQVISEYGEIETWEDLLS